MKINQESTEQTAIRECRRVFLITAASHPKIRLENSLREKAFSPLHKLWIDLGLNNPDFHWTDEGQRASESYRSKLERLIQKWVAGHNLALDWVIDAVREQLICWSSFPKVTAFSFIPGYNAPEFYIDPWFPKETEGAYRRRVIGRFRGALDAHICELKRLHSHVLKDRGSQSAHYHWAAERVCLRWTWARIAMRNPVVVTPEAVRKAVSPILERLGISSKHNLKTKNNGLLGCLNHEPVQLQL